MYISYITDKKSNNDNTKKIDLKRSKITIYKFWERDDAMTPRIRIHYIQSSNCICRLLTITRNVGSAIKSYTS